MHWLVTRKGGEKSRSNFLCTRATSVVESFCRLIGVEKKVSVAAAAAGAVWRRESGSASSGEPFKILTAPTVGKLYVGKESPSHPTYRGYVRPGCRSSI
jgi:hypothetical protein